MSISRADTNVAMMITVTTVCLGAALLAGGCPTTLTDLPTDQLASDVASEAPPVQTSDDSSPDGAIAEQIDTSEASDSIGKAPASVLQGRWSAFLEVPFAKGPAIAELDDQGALTAWHFDDATLQHMVERFGGVSHLGPDSVLLAETVPAGTRTDWVQNVTPGGNPDLYQLDSHGQATYDAQSRRVTWREESTNYEVWLDYEAYVTISMTLTGRLDESGTRIDWDEVAAEMSTFSEFAAECCGATEVVTQEWPLGPAPWTRVD